MTPTCVAPRHVDAPPDFLFLFYFFLRTSSARGGGGGAARLFFFFFPLFSRPRAGLATVSSSFFRAGNQCAECEKQQQQQQQHLAAFTLDMAMDISMETSELTVSFARQIYQTARVTKYIRLFSFTIIRYPESFSFCFLKIGRHSLERN